MNVNDGDVLERIAKVMGRTFALPAGAVVTRSTSSADVDGWDSLSHSIFILGVEDEFGTDLPIDRTYEMANIGDLVDLIAERSNQP